MSEPTATAAVKRARRALPSLPFELAGYDDQWRAFCEEFPGERFNHHGLNMYRFDGTTAVGEVDTDTTIKKWFTECRRKDSSILTEMLNPSRRSFHYVRKKMPIKTRHFFATYELLTPRWSLKHRRSCHNAAFGMHAVRTTLRAKFFKLFQIDSFQYTQLGIKLRAHPEMLSAMAEGLSLGNEELVEDLIVHVTEYAEKHGLRVGSLEEPTRVAAVSAGGDEGGDEEEDDKDEEDEEEDDKDEEHEEEDAEETSPPVSNSYINATHSGSWPRDARSPAPSAFLFLALSHIFEPPESATADLVMRSMPWNILTLEAAIDIVNYACGDAASENTRTADWTLDEWTVILRHVIHRLYTMKFSSRLGAGPTGSRAERESKMKHVFIPTNVVAQMHLHENQADRSLHRRWVMYAMLGKRLLHEKEGIVDAICWIVAKKLGIQIAPIKEAVYEAREALSLNASPARLLIEARLKDVQPDEQLFIREVLEEFRRTSSVSSPAISLEDDNEPEHAIQFAGSDFLAPFGSGPKVMWSEEELNALTAGFLKYGKDWRAISRVVFRGKRSASSVKNMHYRRLQRLNSTKQKTEIVVFD